MNKYLKYFTRKNQALPQSPLSCDTHHFLISADCEISLYAKDFIPQNLDDICDTDSEILSYGHFHIEILPLSFSVYKLVCIPLVSHKRYYPESYCRIGTYTCDHMWYHHIEKWEKRYISHPLTYIHKGLCIYNYQYRCFHYFPHIIGNVVSCNHTITLYTQGSPVTTFPYHDHCYRNGLFYKSIPAVYASY